MRKPKQARVYGQVPRRSFRAEVTVCPTCQTRLERYATPSERTVITLQGPFKPIHSGYRCPNEECATHRRSYRSAVADAQALPGFTLDMVGHPHRLLTGDTEPSPRFSSVFLLPLGTSFFSGHVSS
jgi:hypothetical protein